MSFKDLALKNALNKLQATENEMYELYSTLIKQLRNKDIKKKIKFIRDQELGHASMITQTISICGEDLRKA